MTLPLNKPYPSLLTLVETGQFDNKSTLLPY